MAAVANTLQHSPTWNAGHATNVPGTHAPKRRALQHLVSFLLAAPLPVKRHSAVPRENAKNGQELLPYRRERTILGITPRRKDAMAVQGAGASSCTMLRNLLPSLERRSYRAYYHFGRRWRTKQQTRLTRWRSAACLYADARVGILRQLCFPTPAAFSQPACHLLAWLSVVLLDHDSAWPRPLSIVSCVLYVSLHATISLCMAGLDAFSLLKHIHWHAQSTFLTAFEAGTLRMLDISLIRWRDVHAPPSGGVYCRQPLIS